MKYANDDSKITIVHYSSQEAFFIKSDGMLCDFDVNQISFYLCSSLV